MPLSRRQFTQKPLRLGMNLIIRNEADIIKDNIKYHAAQGVDSFIVIDHGSNDGTREILESLTADFEILIIDKGTEDYQLSNWKTEMAFISRQKFKSDWTIANDADEFWVPGQGNLKSNLSKWGSIIKCHRVNILPDESIYNDNYDYLQSKYLVNYPVLNKKSDIVDHDNLSIMLANIQGKVIVNNHGLIRAKGGNHRAWHWWSFINKRNSDNIKVLHFPIRSIDHFKHHIQMRSDLLDQGVTKMGSHYRRWAKFQKEGRLEEELERLIINDKDAVVLKKFGIINENPDICRSIRNTLEKSKKP